MLVAVGLADYVLPNCGHEVACVIVCGVLNREMYRVPPEDSEQLFWREQEMRSLQYGDVLIVVCEQALARSVSKHADLNNNGTLSMSEASQCAILHAYAHEHSLERLGGW